MVVKILSPECLLYLSQRLSPGLREILEGPGHAEDAETGKEPVSTVVAKGLWKTKWVQNYLIL